MTDDDLAAALRACAAGLYPLEAGVALLISTGAFLRRPDFADRDAVGAVGALRGTLNARQVADPARLPTPSGPRSWWMTRGPLTRQRDEGPSGGPQPPPYCPPRRRLYSWSPAGISAPRGCSAAVKYAASYKLWDSSPRPERRSAALGRFAGPHAASRRHGFRALVAPAGSPPADSRRPRHRSVVCWHARRPATASRRLGAGEGRPGPGHRGLPHRGRRQSSSLTPR